MIKHPPTHCGLGAKDLVYQWQCFEKGDHHIRVSCPKCGKFVVFMNQIEPYKSWIKGLYVKPTDNKPANKKSRDQLEAELAELKEHLKEIEFITPLPIHFCPACKSFVGFQHKKDCWLYNAIKEAHHG